MDYAGTPKCNHKYPCKRKTVEELSKRRNDVKIEQREI